VQFVCRPVMLVVPPLPDVPPVEVPPVEVLPPVEQKMVTQPLPFGTQRSQLALQHSSVAPQTAAPHCVPLVVPPVAALPPVDGAPPDAGAVHCGVTMSQVPATLQYLSTAVSQQPETVGSQMVQESPHCFPAHGTYVFVLDVPPVLVTPPALGAPPAPDEPPELEVHPN